MSCISCAMTVHGAAPRGPNGKSNPSRLYRIWRAMKARCEVSSNVRWERYGGRGVRVCPEWSQSFVAFAEALGEPPSEDHSIDRIDCDGHYEPGNVRWATRLEQAANKSAGGPVEDLPDDFTYEEFVQSHGCSVLGDSEAPF